MALWLILIHCFFQVQIEKKQTPITATNLNAIQTGILTHQPNIYDWISSTDVSKSRCLDVQKNLIDRDSWSLTIGKNSLDYDDKLDKLLLEGPKQVKTLDRDP